ncbi:MAG: DNA-processing protein DprA [Pirellulales bacterium]
MNEASALQSPLPDDDAELVERVRLAMVSGIGPRLAEALLARFGTATAIFSASRDELCQVEGIGAKLSAAIQAGRREIDAAAEIELARRSGITLLARERSRYPRSLLEIADPPSVLYVRGELHPEDSLAIAIVGARHATQYGLQLAERFAASLARAGLTIISGLARGVDGAAHRGALAAGGRTLAVLGSGLLQIYPPEHRELAADVARSGAVISELPLRVKPLAGTFPQRNRLISGMSLGVLVIEASLQSGALITARHAGEQGRDVFAVPGRVDNRMSHGCHRLIRDGAKLVETPDDVLEELGPLSAPTPTADGRVLHHPAELKLNELERQVLDAISGGQSTIDEVVRVSGLPTPQVLAIISALEIRRLVRRLGGNTITRL